MRFEVSYQYFFESESADDSFRFSNRAETLERFNHFRDIINHQWLPMMRANADTSLEIVDEPDFYGVINHATGEWVKTTLS